jgi:hypothetical protein
MSASNQHDAGLIPCYAIAAGHSRSIARPTAGGSGTRTTLVPLPRTHRGQRPVQHRPVQQHIDPGQPVPQHRHADRHRHQHAEQRPQQQAHLVRLTQARTGDTGQTARCGNRQHRDEPDQLPAGRPIRPPLPQQHDCHGGSNGGQHTGQRQNQHRHQHWFRRGDDVRIWQVCGPERHQTRLVRHRIPLVRKDQVADRGGQPDQAQQRTHRMIRPPDQQHTPHPRPGQRAGNRQRRHAGAERRQGGGRECPNGRHHGGRPGQPDTRQPPC